MSFLDVEKSFTGRVWRERESEERQTLAISQRYSLPDSLARAVVARGYDVESAATYLDPKMRDLMPDPSCLLDMDKAVARFITALRTGQKTAVFGDYDVDGATSSALLIRFARALGYDLQLYIPDRLAEGYGPNSDAMRKLKEQGVQLVICVDCGVTAYEPLQTAQEIGLDVIVIDHHAAQPELPPACAIVNPNRVDEKQTERLGHLAAVGVCYLFVVAVNRALRESGFYNGAHAQPDLIQWLDLVALGTVCDVVKLSGLNRAYVAQGLKVMQMRGNAGIAALAKAAGFNQPMDTYAAGFVLGPRLNAAGRVGQSDIGARLLSSADDSEVIGLAQRLHELNEERREIEAQVLLQAESMVFDQDEPLTFLAREDWHPGVIGIVASRLKDKFQRPAIVISLENGIGKGSGRSIGAIDLGQLVIAARQAGLLINGGGHKMAAGLTVAQDQVEALHAFFKERVGKILKAEPFIPSLTLDALVAAPALTPPFLEKLKVLAPFGTGNAEPRFALASCTLVRVDIVGERHVKIIASQGASRIQGIAFRAMETELGPSLLARIGQKCHLAGHARLNVWQGIENVQLFIDDAAPA